ncbi:hypothetical protein NITLEN_50013 [Nitrospira lenta]|uniref:Uncharacterized protein n=2 Tax=Nitrospira lenta TaxID=1436998 RepID=A0A330L987_9BACT|nr:hypothetical protein NITLEN_50013 [Nitrospira lenta]
MHLTLCWFCRRLTPEQAEADSASGGPEMGTSKDTVLGPDNAIIEDAYCHDCERFYHQLITFGRGSHYAAGGTGPDAPIQQHPQPQTTPASARQSRHQPTTNVGLHGSGDRNKASQSP